ncbi:MAG: DUF86 domain-containing protein [Actinomycetota bacterium]|nr:DUF86 domain-containing protein [Actinomycetota bacterium]
MSWERDIGSPVRDMIESCEYIIAFAQGVSDDELPDPRRPVRGAVMHHLTVLGEASKQVSEEWVLRYADIPWKRIAGMRDKIVHHYFGLDDNVVVSTVRMSVPAILLQLRAMLREMDALGD